MDGEEKKEASMDMGADATTGGDMGAGEAMPETPASDTPVA